MADNKQSIRVSNSIEISVSPGWHATVISLCACTDHNCTFASNVLVCFPLSRETYFLLSHLGTTHQRSSSVLESTFHDFLHPAFSSCIDLSRNVDRALKSDAAQLEAPPVEENNPNPSPPPPPPDTNKGYNPALDKPRPAKIENYLKSVLIDIADGISAHIIVNYRFYDVIILIDDSGSVSAASSIQWTSSAQAPL
jgi:hypothetical protein